jgi:glycosyltransferase involved in cell wall biosynthesis
MKCIGVTALVNFDNWENPDFTETGGVNSVIKGILPYLDGEKIVLLGMTHNKERLCREVKVSERISLLPLFYKPTSSVIPNRILGFVYGCRLRKILAEHHIDFIYSHSEELAFWLSFYQVRYIHHLHTYVNALKVSGGKLAKVKVLQHLWEGMRYRVIRKSFKSIAVNNDIALMLKSIIGADRVIRFSNYVDPQIFKYNDPFSIKRKYSLDGKRVALFVGRLTKVKGLEHFVDTIEQLNKMQSGSWVGMVVGNGEYEDTIRHYIDDKNLKQYFVFTGPINNPHELSKYYSLADVFLLTSLSESVPLTLLESLSCGTPVVTTNVGIASEVLGLNNGFIVSTNSGLEMAEMALKALPFKAKVSILNNPEEYSVINASNLLNNEFRK